MSHLRPNNSLPQLRGLITGVILALTALQPSTQAASTGEGNSLNASSVGPGVRFNLRSNLTARFDYGWQLIHLPDAGVGSRSHLASIALTMAY